PCLSGEAGVVDGDGRLCRPQPVWTEQEPPGCTTAVSPDTVKFSLNSLRKNHFGTADLRWPAGLGQEQNTTQDSRGRVRGFRNFEPRTSNFRSRLSRMSRVSRAAVYLRARDVIGRAGCRGPIRRVPKCLARLAKIFHRLFIELRIQLDGPLEASDCLLGIPHAE